VTDQTILDIGAKALWVTIEVSAPVLAAALFMGVLVSIFQAATQINEQTLSFVPKILLITVALVICGPWILHVMMEFTTDLFKTIPEIAR
jgi:flagellar biosynthetic protein FliQ